MRILVVATQIQLPGTHGGSTHVGELIESLRTHGPTMALVRRGSRGKDLVGISLGTGYPAGIKHLFPWMYLPAAWLAARRFKPDVIYERGSSYGLGALLSKLLGVPMLCMVLDNHISPISLNTADRIVATSLELIPAAYRDRAVKVSWGANTQRFHPGIDGLPARRRLQIPDDAFVVGYIGSFKAWHGLEFLIEAAGLLRDRPVHYLLVGDGPEREKIETATAADNLGERFAFTGSIPYESVPDYLAAMDCCVAPFDPRNHPGSQDRDFALDPLKIFEYLAMEKPTITIRTPNLQALFEDGSHLRMVNSADGRALAEAIISVQDAPGDAAAMAKRGYELVVTDHTWQAHADHLVELFEDMLEASE
jgi:glycosyltransferase involved in cell wall biosynthesis